MNREKAGSGQTSSLTQDWATQWSGPGDSSGCQRSRGPDDLSGREWVGWVNTRTLQRNNCLSCAKWVPPYGFLCQDQRFSFSIPLPTMLLINFGLVTTASAPSRQSGTGLWSLSFPPINYLGKPPPGSIIWLQQRNCPGAVLLQPRARN